MTNISNLDKVIVEIKKILLKNENFKKLLKYNTPDALAGAAVNKEDVAAFIKTSPALYMVEQELDLSLNTFSVIYIPTISFSDKLNDVTFIIDLFTRKEILELDNNQLRLHQMLSEAAKSLDNQRISFAGRLHLTSATYVVVGNHYVGFQLEINVIDEAVENDF
jgi:hypothetical protein